MDIAKQLQSDLTAKQCADLLSEAGRRLNTVSERVKAIRPGKNGMGQGHERARILATGTNEQVRQIDDEHADLIIESDRLRAQHQTLQGRLETARAREAAKAVPKLYADLKGRLDALQAAQRALLDAWHDVDKAYADTCQARNLAIRGGHSPKGADRDLLARVVTASAGGCNTKSRVANLGPNMIADELGADPEKVAA